MQVNHLNEEIKKEENAVDVKESISFKELIMEWGSSSSAHGIPGLCNKNSNNKIRFVWICLMISSWTYCFYSIIITLIAFFSYNANSNIQYINEVPTYFPGI